jgi:hypothetical protein
LPCADGGEDTSEVVGDALARRAHAGAALRRKRRPNRGAALGCHSRRAQGPAMSRQIERNNRPRFPCLRSQLHFEATPAVIESTRGE